MTEYRRLALFIIIFTSIYLIPFQHPVVSASILEAFALLQEYAREHVLLCLIPAFFIAGAIANFISQGTVTKYFSSKANPITAYGVASVSGIILAVCSCTVLPLFSGIHRRGAGLGPAVAFLYSGPAVNVLAIILTARVLGWDLGIARAIGAVLFAIIIGLIMAFLFRSEERKRQQSMADQPTDDATQRRTPLQNIIYFAILITILIFATWGQPEQAAGLYYNIFRVKWIIVGLLLLSLTMIVAHWLNRDERRLWVSTTWEFTKQILPLLLIGVLAAGLLMGRPGTDAGLIPTRAIESLVGDNTFQANLVASLVGAFMYFATLTEIPILQGLIGSGMNRGPALALLLAGPALSLPNMLVIHNVLGTKKTAAFITLVALMATLAGMIFGHILQ